MKKTLVWLIVGAAVALILMSGMFWLFYTFPVAIFVLGVLYYIVKGAWQRYFSPRR